MVEDGSSHRSRWVGRVLRERWRIDARLARGGVGTVFAATHKNNGNRVAIKLLHPEFSRDEDTRGRFLQEGYAANQVNHPGVVRILDDDTTEEGLAFLVMELLEGELLERRRVRLGGRLPLREVYEIADQLLDVLAAAHEKGIVHRDIKPDNLFLTTEGRLKVLDFGFAQMKTGFRTEQTATGFLLGTPGFMSPEQAVGARGQIDAKTDIWAVGATLFTLLSGAPVHAGESAAEMLVAAANYPARSLATVAPGLSPKLVQIVDRALAFDKRTRWPSARAMKTALLDVPGRMGEPPVSGEPTEHVPSSDGRTLFEAPIEVEELDAAELEDAKPSAPDQRTMVATAHFDPALLHGVPSPISSAPPRPPSHHPADDERATMARSTPFGSMKPLGAIGGSGAPFGAPHGLPQLDDTPEEPPSAGGSTMIMDNGPALQAAGMPAPRPAAGLPPPPISSAPGTQPFGQGQRRPSMPSAHAFPPGDPRLMPRQSDDMMFVAGPARPPPQDVAGSRRVLIYVGVAVFSMIVVILTGLLILLATD